GPAAADAWDRYRAVLAQTAPDLAVAETFVACEIARLFSYVFAHLRTLLTCATLGGVLLVFAILSYPFQPQQALLELGIASLLLLVGGFAVVVFQAERSPTLSYIGNRTPGKVDFDAAFVSQLATYAGLPLLTVLATQFPALERAVGSLTTWLGR